MTRRLLSAVILFLMAAAGAWMGTKIATDWSRLREIDEGIREQEEAIQAAREGERQLRERIERARSDVAAADSAGADRTGVLMDRAFNIAKLEANVEQDRLRAQRRLRHLRGEREKASNDVRRWGATLAGVEAFLVGGLIVARRYARHGG